MQTSFTDIENTKSRLPRSQGTAEDASQSTEAAQALVVEARQILERAAVLAEKGTAFNPPDPRSLLVVGGIHLSLGDLDEATRCYERVLEHAPEHTDALSSLGVVYHRAGMFHRAADCFKKVILARPTELEPYYRLQNELFFLGKIPELVDILDNALRAYPYLRLADRCDGFLQKQEEAIAARLPCIFMNTMPKSGSVYIHRRLSSGLGVPFSRIAVGTMLQERIVPSWAEQVARGGALTQQHADATATNLYALKASGMTKVIVHVRDPRQATLSLVHHFRLGYREQELHWQKLSMCPYCPEFDILRFERQVQWTFEHYYARYVQWIEDWIRASDDTSHGLDILLVTYEDFHADEHAYFQRLLTFLDMTPDEFLQQPNTSKKTAAFHYRKGMVDEWRQVCTNEQQEWMQTLLTDDVVARFGWTR